MNDLETCCCKSIITETVVGEVYLTPHCKGPELSLNAETGKLPAPGLKTLVYHGWEITNILDKMTVS